MSQLVWLANSTRSGHACGGPELKMMPLELAHLAVQVGKGREIGGTSEDRDSVVQFGSQPPLVPGPSTHLLTSPNSCAVQFGKCRRPDILKPNLISTRFRHTFSSHTMFTNTMRASRLTNIQLLDMKFCDLHVPDGQLIQPAN